MATKGLYANVVEAYGRLRKEDIVKTPTSFDYAATAIVIMEQDGIPYLKAFTFVVGQLAEAPRNSRENVAKGLVEFVVGHSGKELSNFLNIHPHNSIAARRCVPLSTAFPEEFCYRSDPRDSEHFYEHGDATQERLLEARLNP